MIYLVLAVLCTSAINIGFTVAKRRGYDNLNVSLVNYVAGSLTAGLLMAAAGTAFPGFSPVAALGNLSGGLTPEGSFSFSILFGAVTGLAYLAALVLAQRSIAQNGVGLTSMFQRLGVVIPILLSALIWAEAPSALQWAGIALAVAAVAWLGGGGIKLNRSLALVFLLAGLVDFTNRLYQAFSSEEYKPLYLFCVFVSSLGLCAIYRARRGSPGIKPPEALLGAIIGVPNVLAANFIIKSLATLPGSVVFPMISGGTILLITLVSIVCFKEKVSARVWAAVAMIVASLVLVNI